MRMTKGVRRRRGRSAMPGGREASPLPDKTAADKGSAALQGIDDRPLATVFRPIKPPIGCPPHPPQGEIGPRMGREAREAREAKEANPMDKASNQSGATAILALEAKEKAADLIKKMKRTPATVGRPPLSPLWRIPRRARTCTRGLSVWLKVASFIMASLADKQDLTAPIIGWASTAQVSSPSEGAKCFTVEKTIRVVCRDEKK